MYSEKEDKEALIDNLTVWGLTRNLVNDLQGLQIAVFAYMDKYHFPAGDDPAPKIPGAPIAKTPIGKQGNKVIDGAWNSTLATDESVVLFQQLKAAGLIAGGEPRNIFGGRFGIAGVSATGSPIVGLRGSFGVCSDGIPAILAKRMVSEFRDKNILIAQRGRPINAPAISPQSPELTGISIWVVCKGG